MSSTEEEAYKIMLQLDVDYVLVIFGGVIGYSGDDINKFLWMVRIAQGNLLLYIFMNILGVYPNIIKEHEYLPNGEYRVDGGASPVMLNCLMYKLSYYRFGEYQSEPNKPTGKKKKECF